MWRLTLILALCAGGRAAEPVRLQDLLHTAGKAVETFWDEFGGVNCTELISQSKLDRNGKTVYQQSASYDYLVLMKQVDSGLRVAESRVQAQRDRKPPKMPLLVTNGFPMFLLIFHPYFQHSFEFGQPVASELAGRSVFKVAFHQLRNAPAPSALRLRGKDFPLEWAGTAWIEAKSGAIVRIEAGLGTNTEDLGLQSLNAEVTYAPVKFADSAEGVWMPSIAVIEAATPLQHWKNMHQFTQYKRFAVSTNASASNPN